MTSRETGTPAGATERTASRRRAAAAVAGSGAVAVLLATCVLGAAPAAPHHRPGPATVERLAAAAGCAPRIQAARAGVREATCLTGRGSYVMATFRDDGGMRGWVAASNSSGRPALVGSHWAVAGPVAALRPVQSRIGGRVVADGRAGG